MCGWLSAAAFCASARNRARNVGSPVNSLRSTLTATGRPSSTSVPRQTWPMPPAATSPPSSYRSPRHVRPGSTTGPLLSSCSSGRAPCATTGWDPLRRAPCSECPPEAVRTHRSGVNVHVRPWRHRLAGFGGGRPDPAAPHERRTTMSETPASGTVTREDADGVATLTLLRPGLTHESRGELLAAVQAVADDPSVRAVLLTGSGRAFCVGQDLGQHVEALRGNAALSLSVVEDEYNPLVRALAALRVPVVVAVNGACAGAGLGIALAGDLRIAAAGAKFTTAFTGIGLSSDSALASRLVHCVGGSRAAQLLLTPDPFTAETAEQWGLVHRVVPAEEVLAEGQALAARLAAGPTAAYRAVKTVLATAATDSLEDTLALEARLQSELGKTSDHLEAVTAFMEKRSPEFTGR